MTRFTMITRGFSRHRTRTVLTAIGAAAAFMGFILIQTIANAWTITDTHSVNKIITRHGQSLQLGLPLKTADAIANFPGVDMSTYMIWFGGRDPAHPDNEFASMAVQPDNVWDLAGDDVSLDAAARDRWKSTRSAAVIGDALAAGTGWKVGDTITLEASMWPVKDPGPWTFQVVGIYKPLKPSSDASTLFIRYDYFNERLVPSFQNQVRLIRSRLKPGVSTAVESQQIDAMFKNSDTPTLTTDEATFSKGFVASISALLSGLDAVSIALLCVATLLTVSLLSMSTRERVREFGVLRAIGFSTGSVFLLIVGEALLLSTMNGILAVGIATAAIHYLIGPFLMQNAGGTFSVFPISEPALMWVIVVSAVGGLIAGGLPATFALRTRVTDALRDIG